MEFGDVARPAIELAEHGFPVNTLLERNLEKAQARIAQWPSTRSVFLHGGRAPRVGERLIQKDLGRTLRMLAEAGRGAADRRAGLRAVLDLFYRGEIAQRIASFSEECGGFLTYEDLADFEAPVEEPLKTSYRGYDVYSCGPWCQGPVVLQTLNILEGYDMPQLAHNSASSLHLIAEALKGAFADRHAFYGDPHRVDVPMKGLLSKAYAASWRDRIRPNRAFPGMPAPGEPWQYQDGSSRPAPRAEVRPRSASEAADTSYLCVMDADGNAFSATPSDDVTEAPLVPGLGFIISPRGHQSWLDPGHPSSVAPGKRPRLTPSPGLVVREGHVFMPYGTPGLDVQPQAMVQLLINVIDHRLEVMEAIEAPRIATYSFPGSIHPHTYSPGLLRVESRITEAVRNDLAAVGHHVEAWPPWTPHAGGLCAIVRNAGTRILAGGADPRRLAYAIGW
jgi:gamma-glutamyltranspeptidase/glutathione hydrolase